MTFNRQLQKLKGRQLKSKINDILQINEWFDALSNVIMIQKASVVSSLFSFVYNPNPIIKWHAVSGFGILTKILSENDTEKIRIILRRCIWMLTEESGGIPWGIPEVIGEILANNERMASEFSNMLFSYVYNSEGPENYLEHTPLRTGVYWGIYRLSQSNPKIIKDYKYIIEQRISEEKNLIIIAYLLLVINKAEFIELKDFLNNFSNDNREVEIYSNNSFQKMTISSIANKVL